jgi:hypothetical protein
MHFSEQSHLFWNGGSIAIAVYICIYDEISYYFFKIIKKMLCCLITIYTIW